MKSNCIKIALLSAVSAAFLSLNAWAGINASNADGDYDGRYTIVLENNKTRERSEPVEAVLEGNYLTVKYPEGDVTYKISDLYDRRTELEGTIYNNQTKSYMTVHMDDHTHVFHKDQQSKSYQKQSKKSGKKRRKTAAPSPSPSPSPSEEAAAEEK